MDRAKCSGVGDAEGGDDLGGYASMSECSCPTYLPHTTDFPFLLFCSFLFFFFDVGFLLCRAGRYLYAYHTLDNSLPPSLRWSSVEKEQSSKKINEGTHMLRRDTEGRMSWDWSFVLVGNPYFFLATGWPRAQGQWANGLARRWSQERE